MGTEYRLGCHGDEETVSGAGTTLMAYEMSGVFDVYADVPKERVDIDAWDTCARVDLWNKVDPVDLLSMGINIVKIATFAIDLNKEESDIVESVIIELNKIGAIHR